MSLLGFGDGFEGHGGRGGVVGEGGVSDGEGELGAGVGVVGADDALDEVVADDIDVLEVDRS